MTVIAMTQITRPDRYTTTEEQAVEIGELHSAKRA